VLPVAEELCSNGTDDLLTLEDVRVEVMRARGAGGQVGVRLFVPLFCSVLLELSRV
jgi:protein subunit release factor A